jgi:hypothetical protein
MTGKSFLFAAIRLLRSGAADRPIRTIATIAALPHPPIAAIVRTVPPVGCNATSGAPLD